MVCQWKVWGSWWTVHFSLNSMETNHFVKRTSLLLMDSTKRGSMNKLTIHTNVGKKFLNVQRNLWLLHNINVDILLLFYCYNFLAVKLVFKSPYHCSQWHRSICSLCQSSSFLLITDCRGRNHCPWVHDRYRKVISIKINIELNGLISTFCVHFHWFWWWRVNRSCAERKPINKQYITWINYYDS